MKNAEDSTPSRPARRRWLPSPVLSALAAACWLLLQGSLAPADFLWATVLAFVLPWLVHDFLGRYPPLRASSAALRLIGVVAWDIVRANLAVARIVLDPAREPQPAWVRVPYTLTDPRGVVLLATIVTNTPGTVSSVVDEARREIFVHALDAPDPAAIVAEILERYEKPLKEIFR